MRTTRWIAASVFITLSGVSAQAQVAVSENGHHADVNGARTASYFKDVHEALKTWIPRSEADVVPDSTHAMLNTHPKPAAERIAAFLARHPISAAH